MEPTPNRDPSPSEDAAGTPSEGASEPAGSGEGRVDVYWRPGCMYCMSLQRNLRKAGLEVNEIDIWANPEAAAFVRSVANGNETVPTVDIAGTVLVNPPARTVLALAAEAGLWARPPDEDGSAGAGSPRRGWRRGH